MKSAKFQDLLSRKTVRRSSVILAGSVAALFAGHSAQASTFIWDADLVTPGAQDGAGAWSAGSATFWDGAANVATTNDLVTDIAQFGNGGNLASVATVNVGTQNISGLIFGATTNNGYTLTNGSASTLGIGGSGIVLNADAQATTIGSANLTLALGAPHTWTNNSTSFLTVAGGIDNGANLLTVTGTGDTNISGVIGSGAINTGGLTKSGTSFLILSGANSYTGATMINAGTISLTESGTLGATTNTLIFGGTSTVDLGGTSQILGNLATNTSGTVTGTLTNGSLTLSGASNMVVVPGVLTASNQTLDASGLTALSILKPANTLTVGGTSNATTNQISSFKLSLGSNTISVAALNIGTLAGANQTGRNNNGSLLLGTTNTIEVNTVQLGTTRSAANLSFQTSGLGLDPSVSFRGIGGGSNRVASLGIGFNTAGSHPGSVQTADFRLGSIDGRFGTITVSQGGANATSVSGTFAMQTGVVDATNIVLSDNLATGANTPNTGTFTQNAGEVIVDTLTLGQRIGAGVAPRLLPTYNLGTASSSAVLKAQTIQAGAGEVATNSARNIVWNNGTIQNYDASTDLSIDGTSTAAQDRLNIQLTGTAPHIFLADAARTITVGANTLISGTGALTKDGAGTLVLLSGVNTYTGGTILNQGTLKNGTLNSLGPVSGTLTVNGGTLDLNGNNLGVGSLTGAGGIIANNLTGTSQTLTTGDGNASGGNYQGIIADSTSGTGTLALAKVGTGTVSLSGANTYTGGTNVSAGVLTYMDLAAKPSTGTTIVVAAGNLGLGVGGSGRFSSSDIDNLFAGNFVGNLANVSMDAASGVGIDTTAGDFTYATSQSAARSLTKLGENTLTLTGANSYTGGTKINAGILRLSGGNDRLLSTSTVSFGGGSGSFATLDIGSTSQTLAALTVPTGALTTAMTALIAGSGGSLTINGASALQLGPTTIVAGSAALTVDMSGLSNFTYNSPTQTFRVGLQTGGSVLTTTTNQVATVILANGTNNITSNLFAVSDQPGAGNPGQSTLDLGTTNVLNADTFNIGFSGRSGATLQFSPGLNNPTVKIRGTDGVSPVTSFLLGKIANNATNTWTNLVDFSSGGGTVDASVTTMLIGSANADVSLNRQGVLNATYQMGAGTTTVGTLTIGQIANTGGGTTTGTFSGNGAFTMDNAAGTLNATTINFAENTITATTGTNRQVSGTFNLFDGTLNATTVQKGVQTGTATSVTTAFNWSTGTVGNIAGSDLTWTDIPITLLGSGAHTFNVSGSNTATLNTTSIISGVDSGITKSGTGTLILSGANTYTGPTLVNAGTLHVSGVSASISGSTVTVNGGTLGGNGGTVGATTVNSGGTLAPGEGLGTLNFAASLTLAGTAAFEINKTDFTLTADLANITAGTLTLGGVLNVTATGAMLAHGDTFNLFDAPAFAGSFATLNLPALDGGLFWKTSDLAVDGTITVIPEPRVAMSLLSGLGLLLGLRRRRA